MHDGRCVQIRPFRIFLAEMRLRGRLVPAEQSFQHLGNVLGREDTRAASEYHAESLEQTLEI